MCETRWQNGKDLTWSGCSGELGMPTEATECNQTTTKCKNHGKQNMRCYCTSEGCNSKATYPQSCKIFVSSSSLLIKLWRESLEPRGRSVLGCPSI